MTTPKEPKTVIVTGASKGIGRATAKLLVQKGYKVALAARSGYLLEEFAAELRSESGFKDSILTCPTDVTDPKQVADLVKMVKLLWGRIDVLVNNAGMGVDGPIAEVDPQYFREVMELNYFGVINCIQAVVPVMRENGGGTIVNVSSTLGRVPLPNFGGYVASKYALEGLDACLRLELAKDKINVCLVRPSMTKTDFGKNTVNSGYKYSRSKKAPYQEPAENVARAIVRAIRTGKRFTTRTLMGKILIAWRDIMPSWQERAMLHMIPDFENTVEKVEENPEA